jgi:hypothetical protein
MSTPNTVWVGNFADTITEEDLSTFFGGCGTVTSVKIRLGKMIKKSQKRYAFVEFENEESVKTALLLNGTNLLGLPIIVDATITKPPPATGVPLTTVMVCGPHDQPYNTSGGDEPPLIVNTTSRTKEEWSKGLSPFFVGPIPMYGGHTAKNLENAWQYAKVYSDRVDTNNEPTEQYFTWAKNGWNDDKPVRFPMGRGAKPLYSMWDGQKLGYIDARKQIYAPLYSAAVEKTKAFQKLKKIYQDPNRTQCVWLWDFDGYDYVRQGSTLTDVLNDATRPMGHAFVLAMKLEGTPLWSQ